MTRPKTKDELIVAGNASYDKLFDLLNSLPPDVINEELHFDLEKNKEAHWQRDKNIKDVLCHLY